MVTVAQPRPSTVADSRREGHFRRYLRRHREFASALVFLVVMAVLSALGLLLVRAMGAQVLPISTALLTTPVWIFPLHCIEQF